MSHILHWVLGTLAAARTNESSAQMWSEHSTECKRRVGAGDVTGKQSCFEVFHQRCPLHLRGGTTPPPRKARRVHHPMAPVHGHAKAWLLHFRKVCRSRKPPRFHRELLCQSQRSEPPAVTQERMPRRSAFPQRPNSYSGIGLQNDSAGPGMQRANRPSHCVHGHAEFFVVVVAAPLGLSNSKKKRVPLGPRRKESAQ